MSSFLNFMSLNTSVYFHFFYRDGKETTAEGDGFIPDPKDPARLKIQFASGKFIPKN